MTSLWRPLGYHIRTSTNELLAHLQRTGWSLADDDGRTSLWRLDQSTEPLVVVLPANNSGDRELDRIHDALRVVAYSEGRTVPELLSDLSFKGGADTVAIRFTPENAPTGKAPLSVARAAIDAVHDLVIGSASALENTSLVLPSRRPVRAESYADHSLVSTTEGSFVVELVLPLVEPWGDEAAGQVDVDYKSKELLLDVPISPYGRRVATRMKTVVQRSIDLASAVGSGKRPIRDFANPAVTTGNATELAALAGLGGPEHERYEVRFSQAPSATDRSQVPLRLAVTPAQQRVMEDAADYLRTKQPRSGATVTGLVVRLFRDGKIGSGEVVVQGESDDSRSSRRYRMSLSERDYAEAVRAHSEGLRVVATGDLEFAGTRANLRRLNRFAVIDTLE
jgi:hypothetical protein